MEPIFVDLVGDDAEYQERLDRFSEHEKLDVSFLEGGDKEPKIRLIDGTEDFAIIALRPKGKIPGYSLGNSDIRCCTLQSGLTSDFLADHPTWVDDILETIIQPSSYPNLETIVLHLPSRLAQLHRCLRTVENIIFPFLEGHDSNGENITITIHGGSVRIGPQDETSKGKEIIIIVDQVAPKRGEPNFLWDPLMQKTLQRFQGATTEIQLRTSSTKVYHAQTFVAMCSVCCAELHIFEQTLDGFAMATLLQALKGNRKRRRQRDQNLSNSLKVLGLYDVTMKSSDFLSLCKTMEENHSVEKLFIFDLTLEEFPPTIHSMVADSLMKIVAQNRTIHELWFTLDFQYRHDSNHNHPGPDEAAAALQQLQARLYASLLHNGKLGRCFIEGVVDDMPRSDIVDKIDERLNLNFLHLTRIMNHAQWPCTPKILGETLVKAAEKDKMLEAYISTDADEDLNWEPPCLLSHLFRVFQSHPTLVQLIPIP